MLLACVSSRVGAILAAFKLHGQIMATLSTKQAYGLFGFKIGKEKERCLNCCRYDSIVIVFYKYILVGFGINWQRNRKGNKARITYYIVL